MQQVYKMMSQRWTTALYKNTEINRPLMLLEILSQDTKRPFVMLCHKFYMCKAYTVLSR